MAKVTRGSSNGFKALEARLKELDGWQSKAGWFESAKYEDGTPVAYIATIHEFGAPSRNIPPRPFMRPTIGEKKKEWADLALKGAQAILAGKTTARSVLESIALVAAGNVAETIKKIFTPPLKPATVKRKGFSKPLVDSGIMIGSVTGIVEESE